MKVNRTRKIQASIQILKRMLFVAFAYLFYVVFATAAVACTSSQIDVLGNGTQCETSKFQLTTTSLGANDSFNFWMSAQGTFYVDCGDGGTLAGTNVSGKTISKTTNVNVQYSCSWSSAGAHTINFGGVATEYSVVGLDIATTNAAINFGISSNQNKISSISGSLSAIFPQLGDADGEIPHFNSTFDNAGNLVSIPSTLFSGLTGGTNAKYMFYSTFSDCTSLTSIPEGLFKDITDAANSMFSKTFEGCTALTGYIAPTTFAGLTANNAPNATTMWYNTFDNTQLATTCPNGLPQYITGYEGNTNNSTWNGRVSCGCMPGYHVENGVCVVCSNKPANSTYIYDSTASSCPWECDAGYSNHSNLCLAHYDDVCAGPDFYDISLDACTPCPDGYDYNNALGKKSVSECQIRCPIGQWVNEPGVWGYTRIEYLESTGKQYINTGFVHKSTNIRGEIRVGTTENMTSNVNILGNQVDSPKTGYSVGWAPSAFKVWVNKKGDRLNGPTHALSAGSIHDITYELTANKRYLTYDGVTVESTHTGGIVTNNPIHLFDNGVQQMNQNFKGRVYYIKIYEDGVLVHNFLPVKRNTDNVVGIYDTVAGRFFTNDGTGNFTYSDTVPDICVDVGSGYYSVQSPVNYGSTGPRTACPAGLTTQGYGHGADEASDCGHELHFGNYFVYSKTIKPTIPAINLMLGQNDTSYIGLSTTNHTLSKLHLMHNGQEYTAYDDGLINGERDPTTGNRISQQSP